MLLSHAISRHVLGHMKAPDTVPRLGKRSLRAGQLELTPGFLDLERGQGHLILRFFDAQMLLEAEE